MNEWGTRLKHKLKCSVVGLAISGLACAPVEEECGHDGGDGTCVPAGECVDDFTLDASGRCARWKQVGDLPFESRDGLAMKLVDGRVLVTGGREGSTSSVRAAIFDPAAETWSNVDAAPHPRVFHIGVGLNDGRVLVMGDGEAPAIADVDIFEPSTGSWSQGPEAPAADYFAGAFLDAQERVHVVTGREQDLVLDVAAGEWQLGTSPNVPRYAGNRFVLGLPEQSALVAGGQSYNAAGFAYEGSAERFDSQTESWVEIARDPLLARDFFAAAILDEQRVFIVGGYDSEAIASTVVLDAQSGAVELGPTLPNAASGTVAVALEDGTVLVAGGSAEGELFDFALLSDGVTFTEVPPLPEPRTKAYSVLLDDGRVMVFGGVTNASDPSAGNSRATLIFERGRD